MSEPKTTTPLVAPSWESEVRGSSYMDEGKVKITEWNIQEMAALLDQLVERVNQQQEEIEALHDAK